MIKRIKYIPLLLLFLVSFSGHAQTYGNEWINYNQSYYSFKIVKDGIYRLDFNTLTTAGVPLATFQTENIQLFGREKELPIHIVDGDNNGFIDAGDYILFYAEKNDGWLDSTIYNDPNTIANPAYSLYNDTIQYFFSWNNSTNNLRYQVETATDFSNYSSIADYILYTYEKEYNNEYSEGERISTGSSSFYNPGEGWAKWSVNGATGSGYTIDLGSTTLFPFTGPSAPLVKFHGKSISASNADYTGFGNHHFKWEIGTSNTLLLDTIFIGYDQIIVNETISSSLLTNGATPIRWSIIDDQGAITDRQAVNYFTVTYPRIPNFSGSNNILFNVVNDPQGKIRLDVTNAGYSIPIMFVHGDIPMMVPFSINGSSHSVLIPNSSNGIDQTIIYKDSSLIIDVLEVDPVGVMGDGSFTDFASIPSSLEDALLFIYHSKLESTSLNYAAYRNSIAGGNYNVVMANVDELYMQFGGGIEKHINGIRRFSHFVFNNSTNKPVGLFIMGKGIRESTYNSITSDGPGTRNNPVRFAASLIPSFGQPSSDVSITAGLEGGYNWAPLIPTGRISVRTETELQAYLDKVILNEIEQDPNSIYDTPSKDWQKHIMHFAGGSDFAQQTQFQSYFNTYENIIEDSLFGGFVHPIYKTSSDPLDPTILSGITDRIEEGVSLMTYFGHSVPTTSGFEINLDDPSNWNNLGKNPLMLVNSCYNGNIFQMSNSNSEEFVQVANFGAIGYIASVSVGFDVYLNVYAKELYKQFSKYNYGSTVAEQMKLTIESLESLYPTNFYIETTCSQMVLNGDPMFRLNYHQNPEIELTQPNVYFTPSELDLTVDSIEMHIILTNLGQSVTDTFSLEVVRNFPSSNTDSVYYFQLSKLDYKDTFSFKMPLQPNIGVGINTFNISVDLPSTINEQYDEINNNQLIKTLYIDIDGIVPVIPYEFAVVPIDSVTVKASTINPIADYNTYRFEIDTTDLFDSPEHRYKIVMGLGGVKEVNPSDWISTSTGLNSTLICTDSTVYFWRVAIDSSTYDWRESSFQYIIGKEGWGQDHFFQFKNNGFSGINYDRPTRTRQFQPFSKELTCDVIASTAGLNIYYNAWFIDAEQQDYGICTYTPKLHVAVIDPVTLKSWGTRFVPENENLGNNFGNNNDNGACLPRVMKFFTFNQNDPAKLTAFQNMVNTEVPDGHYILIYSPMTTRYDLWNALDSVNMYNTFTGLGSDSINGGRLNTPFAFFVKKGDPSTVVELFGQTSIDDVHLTATLNGNGEGNESAPLIGPAAQWGNVYWKQDPQEASSADSTILTIKAYNLGGALQFSIDTLFTLNDSILNLNSIVDANLYPFVSFDAHYIDVVTNTPSQVDRWHVLYTPVPEAAIDGTTQYTWSIPSDTLEEGQNVDFAVDIKNIFTVDMDSLLVSYWVEDANQNKNIIAYARQDSLRVNEVLRDTITFSTVGLGGINSLWVEVNPYVNGSIYVTDQPEQEHFNNLLQVAFFVKPDDINPILDVTINGTHILNGDIIDPNSEILVTLKDDNEFLIMDDIADTSLFGVYLTDPNGVQVRIPFMDGSGTTIMQWIPAEQQHKRFKIIWPASFDIDGTYSLFIQGTDKSGNVSGDLEYRVSFEIIHESSITQMMNYPNPFSTSTRFVFTLTGSEVPDEIIIQIMTVSGRVVREITEGQLGTIQIGRNITEYAWDGRDEFGDQLANGVYLYNVKAQINGEDITHRESGADTYFKKNFGKMYLMR